MLSGTAMSGCKAMGMDDREAFIAACIHGELSVVRNLSGRVDINTPNWQRETGLMQAALHGNKDIVEYLLNCGADPLLKNSQGKTALDYAIQSDAPEAGQAAIVTMMLNAAEAHSGAVEGAGGEAAKKNLGDVIVDALVSAVEKNKFEIVKILLAKKPEFLHVFKNLAQRAQIAGRRNPELSKISQAASFLLSLRNAQLRVEDPDAGVCAICMEPNSFGIGAEVALPLCGHYSCSSCMERSRKRAQENEAKKAENAGRAGLAVVGYCPTCRKIFDTPAFVFRLQAVPNLQEFLQQAVSPAQEKKEEVPAEEKKAAPLVEETKDEAGAWACPMCTLKNREQYLACQGCGAQKPLQPHLNEWKCSACTFLNSSGNVACTMCGAQRVEESIVPPLIPLVHPMPRIIPAAAPVQAQPALRPAPHIDIVRLQKVQKQELQRGVARDVWHDMKMHRDRRLSDIFNEHLAKVFTKK
jgi:hypothetical protein